MAAARSSDPLVRDGRRAAVSNRWGDGVLPLPLRGAGFGGEAK